MLDDVNKNPATGMGKDVSTVRTLHRTVLNSHLWLAGQNPSTMWYHEKERMGIGLERGNRRIRIIKSLQ